MRDRPQCELQPTIFRFKDWVTCFGECFCLHEKEEVNQLQPKSDGYEKGVAPRALFNESHSVCVNHGIGTGTADCVLQKQGQFG